MKITVHTHDGPIDIECLSCLTVSLASSESYQARYFIEEDLAFSHQIACLHMALVEILNRTKPVETPND